MLKNIIIGFSLVITPSLIPGLEIVVIKPEQRQVVKELIIDVAYEVFQLGVDKKDFQKEVDTSDEFFDIENVEEVYLNNRGLFLVVVDDNHNVVGSGALKRLDDDIAELKRMWFLKEYRGKGLALELTNQLIDFAKVHGYKKIRLDIWLPEKQQRAIAFYKKLGFYEIEPYNQSSAKLFMEKRINEVADLSDESKL